jgi:hypothetical protein
VLGEAHVTAYMRPRGYATLAITSQDAKGPAGQVRLDVASGARRVLVSQPWNACAVLSETIPSPSGDRIALVTRQTKCGVRSTPSARAETLILGTPTDEKFGCQG